MSERQRANQINMPPRPLAPSEAVTPRTEEVVV